MNDQSTVNLRAERAVISALLTNNNIFDNLNSFLMEEHFADPRFAAIYAVACERIPRGAVVNAITLSHSLKADENFAEFDNIDIFLAELATEVVSVSQAPHYAKVVHDLAIRRELVRLGGDISERARLDHGVSSENLITDAESSLYKMAERGRYEGGAVTFEEAMRMAIEHAEAAFQRDGGLAGLSTGLRDLDAKLGGLHPSDLLILAGRPSMGKTALATTIAFNVANNHRKAKTASGKEKIIDGGPVAFFSLEMSAEQLAARILSEQSEINSSQIRRGMINKEEMVRLADVARRLEEVELYVDDTPALPISTLAARCRKLKRQHNIQLVVVDYLQLLRPPSSRSGDNRVQELSEITQGLKALAKELSVPVVALSQLSRAVEQREDKRPQLSDLRESGSIEQDADVVMFVFREEYYVGRTEPREGTVEHEQWKQKMDEVYGMAELIIGKQRHGPIGTVKLHFNGDFTRFGNLAHQSNGGWEG
ncbi:MAG TPA: replicative DNA helicase [Alphaproteobacteria bacterium]|nr:MAG: replicative DNA helicase [SAR116 cluster bacterium]HCJ61382.1 replicative DNA helicase [Alphaproteobacteria bacterium]HCY47766.1 replicative DNA helicase [Alphaproteobacteria bacterium]|tara:strand:+ start:614 stop:2059 length:1446 start_codon:yes stop_codon:yes gene_type:complete